LAAQTWLNKMSFIAPISTARRYDQFHILAGSGSSFTAFDDRRITMKINVCRSAHLMGRRWKSGRCRRITGKPALRHRWKNHTDTAALAAEVAELESALAAMKGVTG
jgi:hypothetical protein